MLIGNRNDVIFTLNWFGKLDCCEQVKDLGINVNNVCKFNCHINKITARAHASYVDP